MNMAIHDQDPALVGISALVGVGPGPTYSCMLLLDWYIPPCYSTNMKPRTIQGTWLYRSDEIIIRGTDPLRA